MAYAQVPITGHRCKNTRQCRSRRCRGCGETFCGKCEDNYHRHYEIKSGDDRQQQVHPSYSSMDSDSSVNVCQDKDEARITSKYQESLLSKLQDLLQTEEKWYRKTKQKLDNQKMELIEAVNSVYDDFSNEVYKTYKHNLDLLKAEKDKIKTMTAQSHEKNINLQKYFDELKQTQYEFKMCHFEETKIDISDVKVIFGNLVSETNCKSSSGLVVDIAPVSTRFAWIHRFGTSRIELFTDTKSVTDVIDIDIENCDGFIITKEETLVYSDYDNKCLKSLTRRQDNGSEINILHSFTNLHPYGLCNTNDGGILVCLNEHDVCDVVNKHTLKTKRFIQHFSQNGKLLNTIGWRKSHSNYVFNFPTRVKQNRNSDICVIDRISEDKGHLYVMDIKGEVRCCYRGQSDVFDPGDVCYDTSDNILVSSGVNHSIYILNSNGLFIKRINIKQYIPNAHSLALFINTLWIGNTEGDIRVFSYKDMRLKVFKQSQ